ncbi:MAG TPA: carboxypeptidase regulatory-like domain-containing protein [Bryobacteraceae bacterium]|nr:carboxypeptidase regulatory-like domain-containing protein [Bryobacteraceae bacterium]
MLHKAGIIALLAAAAAHAQTWRGTISGTVMNETRTAVNGTHVSLRSEETGRVWTAVSDAAGEFAFAALRPGAYRLEIAQQGLRAYAQPITLLVNQNVHVDAVLLPAARTDEVSVSGAAELVRTESAALSGVLDTRMIRGLPLDGRNFYELTLLLPGVVPPAQGSAGTVRGDFAVHVNGAREDANNFILDGVYNGDPKLGGVAATPPVDAIREFEVLTSTYDASFGRSGGGQINVVLQSGTNRVHGTAYEFLRNAALDARNRFAPADHGDPQHQRNQFGVALGGPLRRDRTFVFGDYEGRRVREGVPRITNVPTGLERIGDFSQSARPPIDLLLQQPFAGNRIPAERLHPMGRAILALYPLPNRNVPGENFVSSPARRDRSDSFDLRLDQHLGSASELTARYSFNDRDLLEPFSGTTFSAIPGYGTLVSRRAQNAMISETHAFRTYFLNDIRAGYNRVAGGTLQQARAAATNRDIGLPEVSANIRDRGLSFISLPGYSPLGDEYNNPQHSVTDVYQLIDQATVSRGRHLLRFGGDVRALRQNAFRDVQSRGFLSFIGISGNPLGDVLQGLPTVTGVARLDNHQNLRTESYSGFVHDTLRLTRSLVLSAGVRYEYNSPPVDARDRARLYDIARGDLTDAGRAGVPRSGYDPDRNNWAPRLGFAWAPGARNTVLRAAWGVYYDQSSLAPGEGLYFSPPYFDLRLFVTSAQAPLLLHDPFPASYPFPSPSSALAFQRDLRTAYMQHWNFNVQQALGRTRVVEIGYVGSKGTKLLTARDINQPRPSAAPFYLRPNPRFEDITMLESRGSSTYHSLQARFQQRFSRGVSSIIAYTFGKSIDDASNFFSSAGDPSFPQDSYNLRAERARSSFDVRHRASVSYSWELPIAKRSRLLGGWQTHGVWTFQTGRPFTVALLPDLDNSNTGRSTLGFGANDRPNVAGDPRAGARSPARWFNTAAFAIPPRGQFGNSGRNALDGPGLATVNASVLKDTAVTEGLVLQLRAEAFNLLNRTNYDLPDIFLGSPTFGRILSAQSARRLQLGVKLLF